MADRDGGPEPRTEMKMALVGVEYDKRREPRFGPGRETFSVIHVAGNGVSRAFTGPYQLAWLSPVLHRVDLDRQSRPRFVPLRADFTRTLTGFCRRWFPMAAYAYTGTRPWSRTAMAVRHWITAVLLRSRFLVTL